MREYQDSLVLLSVIMETSPSNDERVKTGGQFRDLIAGMLKNPSSFEFPFDSLKSLSKITAPDRSFRLYTWMIRTVDKSRYTYSGFIQMQGEKENPGKLFLLSDSSLQMNEPHRAKLRNDNWFGAYYFKIIQNKKTYTLLGWKGKDLQSTMKVIDALSFSGGKPKFGTGIFPSVIRKDKKPMKNLNRILFEYNSRAAMTLKYESKMDMIIFDHLAPPDRSMEGIFNFYGPDLSFDGLQFSGSRWIYFPDVDVRNPDAPVRKHRRTSREKELYKTK